MGSAPIGLTGGVEYAIEIHAADATHGPSSSVLLEVPDAMNLGYSRYDRLPGKAFFTLPQSSPFVDLFGAVKLGTISSSVGATFHVSLWRITTAGATRVFRGIIMDNDDTGDDVIFDCYDYKALLSLSRSGFKTLYPTKLLGSEIVTPEITAGIAAGESVIEFLTIGTIEDPLGEDAVTPIKTNAQFGTLDQPRLQLFFDLTEMGRANTANRVTFDIDSSNVFHFLKNQTGSASFELSLNGTISDYHWGPGWTRYRNDIATIGVGSAGGPSEITAEGDADNLAIMGRRQDVTTLKTLAGVAGGTTEADQQKAALEGSLYRLLNYPGNLSVEIERGTIAPDLVNMNDTVACEIVNGRDTLTRSPIIVGKRVFYDESGEDLAILLDYPVGLAVSGG